MRRHSLLQNAVVAATKGMRDGPTNEAGGRRDFGLAADVVATWESSTKMKNLCSHSE